MQKLYSVLLCTLITISTLTAGDDKADYAAYMQGYNFHKKEMIKEKSSLITSSSFCRAYYGSIGNVIQINNCKFGAIMANVKNPAITFEKFKKSGGGIYFSKAISNSEFNRL